MGDKNGQNISRWQSKGMEHAATGEQHAERGRHAEHLSIFSRTDII